MLFQQLRVTVLACTILLSVSINLWAAPLTIAYPDFPPFFIAKKSNAPEGIFIDIISESLEQNMHIPVKWEQFPWSRCQKYLQHGMVDAILTVPTKERERYTTTHPTPFFSKELKIFAFYNHPQIQQIRELQSVEDIKNMHFSVITYAGNGWNKTHIESLGIPTFTTPSIVQVWNMLAMHHGDLVIEWPPAALPALQKLQLEGTIVDTGKTIATMDFHLLIQKQSPYQSILSKFDSTIQQMQRNGTIQKILLKYSNTPCKTIHPYF